MRLLLRPVAAAAVLLAALAVAPPGVAQSIDHARAAARKALQANPEVTSRLHAYLGRLEAQSAARAGWMPRLDLTAEAGAGRINDRFGSTGSGTVAHGSAGLALTQVLWDGLATRHGVDRAGHERLARWFDLVDTAEQTALEATRAVYDVQRLRKLAALADDNLLQHRQAASKIEERLKAGVGRGVDVEQARARLALAESNRDTELANLHDVAARYQRIVGELPGADAGSIELLRGHLPASAQETVDLALARHPSIAAGIEGVRAARAAEGVARAALQPQLAARAQVAGGHNVASVEGRRADASVGLVLNWNLFDGGADRARVREQQQVVQQALDARDKACRDVRQNALVAFSDAQRLTAQIGTLSRNAAAIERARDAYRQQYDIGQRSLLDLLNAENESYTARRALTNAVYDRAVAYARTMAATAQLIVRLDLAREAALPADANGWAAGGDAASRCPAQTVDVAALRGAADAAPPLTGGLDAVPVSAGAGPVTVAPPAPGVALPVRTGGVAAAPPGPRGAAADTPPAPDAAAAPDRRARAPARPSSPSSPPSPAPPSSQALPAAAGNAATARATAAAPTDRGWVAAAPSSTAGGSSSSAALLTALDRAAADDRGAVTPAAARVSQRLQAWAARWRQRDAAALPDFYGPGFGGSAGSASAWRAQLRRELAGNGELDFEVEDLEVLDLGDGRVETRFLQSRTLPSGLDVQAVTLTWRELQGQWRIVRDKRV